jgi:hypothetical protein
MCPVNGGASSRWPVFSPSGPTFLETAASGPVDRVIYALPTKKAPAAKSPALDAACTRTTAAARRVRQLALSG